MVELFQKYLLKEGDTVKFDDPLMKIDTTRFQATLEERVDKNIYHY